MYRVGEREFVPLRSTRDRFLTVFFADNCNLNQVGSTTSATAHKSKEFIVIIWCKPLQLIEALEIEVIHKRI